MTQLHRPGVSVLFARSDSCYFDLVADVWDMRRDARNYVGTNPVVCHPPCRGWGRLRHWAKPRLDEKALALFAVEQVRRCGGVLEHPWGSTLWHAASLPHPGKVDAWGGWTLLVDQGWWGHAAPKPTYLYIVGCTRKQVGELPVQLQRAAGRTLKLSPADRERTPPSFARFLVGLAAKCAGSQLQPSIAVTASCATSVVTATAALAVTAGQVRCYSDQAADRRARAAEKRAAFRAWSLETTGDPHSATSAAPQGCAGQGMGSMPMSPDVQPVPLENSHTARATAQGIVTRMGQDRNGLGGEAIEPGPEGMRPAFVGARGCSGFHPDCDDAPAGQACAACAGAAALHTPPSNTGVNKVSEGGACQ